MARNVKSAKNGTATIEGSDVDDVSDITVTEEVEGQEYATSSTNGTKFEVAGHIKRSGSFTVKDDQFQAPGSVVTLILTSDGSVELFNGNALLKTRNPSVPIEGGDVVETVVDWAEAEEC